MKYQQLVDAANENLLRRKQEQLGKIAAAQSEIIKHLRQHPLVNTIAGPIIESLCRSSGWLSGQGWPSEIEQSMILLRMAGRDSDASTICSISGTEPVERLIRAVISSTDEIEKIDKSIGRCEHIGRWMSEHPDLK